MPRLASSSVAVLLVRAAKAAFVKESGLEDIAKRVDDLQLPKPNCFENLDKPRKELALLYVEDHDAVGWPVTTTRTRTFTVFSCRSEIARKPATQRVLVGHMASVVGLFL